MQTVQTKRRLAARPRTRPEADTNYVHVSRVDLDLRPDGEPVLRRVRRCDMLPGDVETDLGETVIRVTKGCVAVEATFHLPEMPGPVTLPASSDGQRDAVKRLMDQYRPGQVYGRDYLIGGGTLR